MNKILQFKNALQALECYSPTSIQARVLVVQASVAGYLTRFAIDFFCTICSTQENKEITTNEPRMRTTFQPVLNQEFLFGSRVAVFLRDLSCLMYWLLRPFFYKEATCEGSTIKGLLYAAKVVP
jgi:hypothetical protein